MNKISAQTNQDIFDRLSTQGSSRGTVNITQENGITELVNFHLIQQKAIKGIRGYAISIFIDSGQEASENANKVMSQFISKYEAEYEDVKCYKRFESPFYKVYVGDFRTKSDALRFYQVIKRDYPEDAFIREVIIPFPE